jgi:DNA-directed RNA polymerase specialized sigma24 family protein
MAERRAPRVLEPASHLRSIATRRSMLPPAGGRSDPQWEASWRHLFETYAPAMRRYVTALLGSRSGSTVNTEDAAEIVQEYLTKAMEKGWLEREVGDVRCFRAYLQVQLQRFTWSWLRHRRAQRRDPVGTTGLEALEAVPAPSEDADAELDAGVVRAALDRALDRLREGNEVYAEIVADLLRTQGEGSADLAARIGRDPEDLPILRHRARRRIAALFVIELRSTVRSEEDFDALLSRLEPHLP